VLLLIEGMPSPNLLAQPKGCLLALSKTEMNIDPLGGCSFQAKSWLCYLKPRTNTIQLHVIAVLLVITIHQI
jgi:hypothetical protein